MTGSSYRSVRQNTNPRYTMAMKRCPCTFLGCLGSSHTCNVLRLHFNRQHWEDRTRILEDYTNPLPRCKSCGSQFPLGRLNTRHYALEKRKQGEERRLRRETLQRFFKASRVSFQIKAETLSPSEAFRYLGRTINYNNINWTVVYLYLRKIGGNWE